MARKRAAVLISGRGSNMAALIGAARDPSYPAEIALVISNRPDAAGLAHAQECGIPTKVVDHKRAGGREDFEQALQTVLEQHEIDVVCLAGFMRVLTPWLLSRWPARLINVHPALLPAFPGLGTHARALATGVRIHGATVHFVVPEVDAGPIIVQGAVPVLADDTEETLAKRVLAVEHRIYPQALRWLAEGRIALAGARCRIAGEGAPADALIVPCDPPRP
ncbi:MAG TPA: phosphoribosylglycinamide formyltransferase [Xanthobacteraceae bacterium]|nr:phosphoribosylglycinamide formyltransferase [Xanthobacteraceae bacterium]